MVASHSKLTYEDLVGFPEDNLRHEIIDGVHYVTPAPVTRHQRILVELLYALRRHLEAHPRGEVFVAPFDAVLSRHDIVEPDLVYISNERRAFLTEQNLQGPPDLTVEILSPGTRLRDRRLKRDLYERAGVLEYWIVDPARDELTIHRRAGEGFGEPVTLSKAAGDHATTPLLPGLTVPFVRVLA